MAAVKDCTQTDVSALSDRMKTLQASLDAFAKETRDIAVEQRVLETLAYEEAYQRFDQIKAAHQDTFGWIFDQKFSKESPSAQSYFCRMAAI